jgi:hypothetical protein
MKKILTSLASSSSSGSLASALRKKRFRDFLDIIATMEGKTLTILDVGGWERYWEIQGFVNSGHQIILLNLTAAETHHPNIISIAGDARDLSRYDDQSIDIVFSNSVIEHLFTFKDQQRMADEIRRVGKKYYVQTPSYGFPMEPHFLFPFFHWLPLSARVLLVRHFALGWYAKQPSDADAKKLVCEIRLVSKREFSKLFPDAVIRHERFLGLTKSFIAVKT